MYTLARRRRAARRAADLDGDEDLAVQEEHDQRVDAAYRRDDEEGIVEDVGLLGVDLIVGAVCRGEG